MDEIMAERPRAVLIGLFQGLKDEYDIEESMIELSELARAAGAEVAEIMIQNKAKIEAATYIGSGKVEEVKLMVEQTDCNMVIFNDELSGAQIRNLENLMDVKVIDRTALILDIFAIRAQTKTAKLQVELAQLRYRLPRLTGFGGQLSKQGGGIGTRGPGEQKLEIDRRRIQERVDEIRKQVKEVQKNRTVQRQLREKREVPIVALVGYTNAGKSSIMNQLIRMSTEGEEDKQVFEKDMLFATLDTSNRRIVLEDKKEFILTDTVGFVSKLPHSIVDAFKATLEEALSADLLIHVVDASNPHHPMQMEVTHHVLKELGAAELPMMTVFNKIDLVEDQAALFGDGINISAKTGENFDHLLEHIKKSVFNSMVRAIFLVPYSDGKTTSFLCENYQVDRMDHLEEGTLLELEVQEKDYNRLSQYLR
ncbi:MAG: GTPase HflX [Clostridia bacterium]|nr:GTPase HflX [Clostridia bacterium]